MSKFDLSRRVKVVVLGDTRDLHHHGCEAVIGQLLRGLEEVGLSPNQLVNGFDWRGNDEECLGADLVVINGEGALHHNRPVVREVIELAKQRRQLNRPTALVNASWFQNEVVLTRELSSFDLLGLRDPLSRAEVVAQGLSVMTAPDLAIRQAGLMFEENRPATIGLAVSDSTDVQITKELRRLARSRGWGYLPVLYSPREPRPGAKSQKIWKKLKIARALGPLAEWFMSPRYHAHLVGSSTLPGYLEALLGCDGVVTGRFHTACFCIGLGVPFLAVASNTSKIESLLRDAGLDPEKRMIQGTMIGTIHEVPDFSPGELAALAEFRRESEFRFRELFEGIRHLLSAIP